MSLNIRIKGYKAAVRKLEAAVGKGMRNCVPCRFRLRLSWPNPEKSRLRSEEVFKAKCEFCQSEYGLSLAGVPELGRSFLRLQYSFTLKDEYTNPKAHAFKLWLEFSSENKKGQGRSAADKRKANMKRARINAKLQEEFDELLMRKHKRLKAKYGELPFPEHRELIESVRNRESRRSTTHPNLRGLIELERRETGHLICAELEKIIWGETRYTTAAAIEIVGRQIDALISTAEDAAKRRKEEGRKPEVSQASPKAEPRRLQAAPDDGKSAVIDRDHDDGTPTKRPTMMTLNPDGTTKIKEF
jgi:hypothetical protein